MVQEQPWTGWGYRTPCWYQGAAVSVANSYNLPMLQLRARHEGGWCVDWRKAMAKATCPPHWWLLGDHGETIPAVCKKCHAKKEIRPRMEYFLFAMNIDEQPR